MTSYYDQQRALGEAYERYIARRLELEGLEVRRHETKQEQLELGDLRILRTGVVVDVELKYDLLFAKTGNLYVEVAEKRRRQQALWIPSGIASSSSAALYGIGDYEHFFLFSRTELVNWRSIVAPPTITIGLETSKGFLLTPAQRVLLGPQTWRWRRGRTDPALTPEPAAARRFSSRHP